MQFQIVCKHCHRSFVITSEGGKTLRCNCPYCGESMVVATPSEEHSNGYNKATTQTKHSKFISGVGKMTIIVFTIVFVGILALSSLLYIIFSAMSN